MTQDRIIQLLEEIRDLQASQLEHIKEMKERNAQVVERSKEFVSESDNQLAEFIEQRRTESQSARMRSNVLLLIAVLALLIIVFQFFHASS